VSVVCCAVLCCVVCVLGVVCVLCVGYVLGVFECWVL
jgi:hypothetical protein